MGKPRRACERVVACLVCSLGMLGSYLPISCADADQKAYAAMELQTMALDSRSQVRRLRIL